MEARAAMAGSGRRRGGYEPALGQGYPPVGSETALTSEQENILLEHLPVVRYLARRIHERLPQHVEMEDLVSAGVVGLMDAFAKFDPDKRVQFRSYAQFRIRGAIIDSLRTLDWSPRELRRKGRAVEEAIRILTAHATYRGQSCLHASLPAFWPASRYMSGSWCGRPALRFPTLILRMSTLPAAWVDPSFS